MKSIIEEILFVDSGLEKRNKQLTISSKALDEIIECDKQLTALLKKDSEKLRIYEKFKQASDDCSADEAIEFYKAGFCYGFRLALEVMKEE